MAIGHLYKVTFLEEPDLPASARNCNGLLSSISALLNARDLSVLICSIIVALRV
jgi:hypothetical protein